MTDEEAMAFLNANVDSVLDGIMELDCNDDGKSAMAMNVATTLVLSVLRIEFEPSDELLDTTCDEIETFLLSIVTKVRKLTQ